jgi:hypothetical protein
MFDIGLYHVEPDFLNKQKSIIVRKKNKSRNYKKKYIIYIFDIFNNNS